MKKFLFALIIFSSLTSSASPTFEVDKDVLRSFGVLFPKATEVKWVEEENSFVANFINEGIQSRLVYDRNTRRMKLTRYYTGEHLPYVIALQIRKKFPKAVVSGVTEVSSVAKKGNLLSTEYFLVLEDEEHLTNFWIRRNGKLSKTSTYRKQLH